MAALDFPSSPTDGQQYEGYTYDSTKGAWQWDVVEPTIANLNDTIVGSPEEGDVLVYNGSAWVNGDPPPGDNLLYNGAMQVAQRGTSETGITSNGYYTADRWRTVVTNAGTWTQTIEADGPTGSGFTKSLKVEVTTADGSLAASDQFGVEQLLEGQDLQGLKKGTASADLITLSFWAKSNVTGTYIVWVQDTDNSRMISASYSISSSGVWEKKTITFPGDTSGVLNNDNDDSLRIRFYLAAGSDFTSGTLQTSWGAVALSDIAPGQTNLAASTSNYWQVTGVQLETGTVATGFDHKPYGVELVECQRYYQVIAEGSGQSLGAGTYYSNTNINGVLFFPATMRVAPTLSATSGTNFYAVDSAGSSDNIDSLNALYVTPSALRYNNTSEASGTSGNGAVIRTSNSSSKVAVDAEL